MSEADKRNLMAIDDLGDELGDIIDWAIAFKHGGELTRDFKPLDGMSIGSIYEKPSTRTRVSFEVGVSRLGGQPLTLLSNDIQLGKSESIADTAAQEYRPNQHHEHWFRNQTRPMQPGSLQEILHQILSLLRQEDSVVGYRRDSPRVRVR